MEVHSSLCGISYKLIAKGYTGIIDAVYRHSLWFHDPTQIHKQQE